MDLTQLINSVDHKSPLYYILIAIYVVSMLTPYFKALAKNTKLNHLASRSAYILEEAKEVVAPIANEVGLANADRREKAVDKLYAFLTEHKINVKRNDLYAVVETAYQYMKQHGYLNDKQPITTPAPEDLTKDELNALTPNADSFEDKAVVQNEQKEQQNDKEGE
ncbi:phage holin, LLH family [Apilactobacillus sp. 1-1-2]|uniref:phage holin, LLH family n=1 Tax=Apilactobacillus sp. 1-1-2 TaxID=3411035 RepID=UPI003B95DFF7